MVATMAATLSAQDAELREFWRDLCPGMSIEGGATADPAAVGDTNLLLSTLKREGYIQVPGAFSEASIAPIREAVSTLFELGIPLPFAFVYDELLARVPRSLEVPVDGPRSGLPCAPRLLGLARAPQ